jgi:hypothetical protein
MRRTIAVAAAAAALSTFSHIGLSRSAPQPVRRGSLDLSVPYIPPPWEKPTREQVAAANARIARAEAKRARKAARNMKLVASGGLSAA